MVRIAGVLFAFAVIAAACGGNSGSTIESTTGDPAPETATETATTTPTEEPVPVDTTVVSADGILTVDVPAGAAGAAVEIARLENAGLPPEVLGDGVVVVGYELSPDASEFAEPLVLTFRVDPAELGLDLADGTVPLGFLFTQDADGEFESLGGVLSREGDMVMARAEVTHFSPAFLVISWDWAVALVPDTVNLVIGELTPVEILLAHEVLGHQSLDDWSTYLADWTAEAPFATARVQTGPGAVSCSAPTDELVTDAFAVRISTASSFRGFVEPKHFAFVAIFESLFELDVASPVRATVIELAGDGTCSKTLPSVATANPAANILSLLVTQGSLVFTVVVDGDGQAMAEAPNTQWHQPIFTFGTPDGAFEIRGTWTRSGQFEGKVFDEDFKLIGEATVTGEWTSSDTMVITASGFGSDDLPNLVKLELGVRITEADGSISTFGDVATWEP